MIRAFHGDPAIRSDVIARLERHADAGTLSFGASHWDGTSGTPLGVAAESAAIEDYAARFGYPLALAGLLDPIAASVPASACDTAIAWHRCVRPGTDLSDVPLRILIDLLERLGAPDLAPRRFAVVVAQHRREAAGYIADRATWTPLRTAIETEEAAADDAIRAALGACALACWPLATSRSVLVGLIHAWATAIPVVPDPDFDAVQKQAADAALHALWEETQPQRDFGDAVHLPDLFRTRHPDLARRFEANLASTNAAYAARATQLPTMVLAHLAAASAA